MEQDPNKQVKTVFIGKMVDAMSDSYGWKKLGDSEMAEVIDLYVTCLDEVGAPYEYYGALKEAMVRTRTKAMAEGTVPPRVTPEFMAATYLRIKSEQTSDSHERIREEKARLKANCQRCLGTGFKTGTHTAVVNDKTTEVKSAVKCEHEPLTEAEIAERQQQVAKAREKYPEIFDAVDQIMSTGKVAKVIGLVNKKL
jgi:hypothetical protein